MSQLDRLEQRGSVVRRPDARDRRARIPDSTEAGRALRAEVARTCDRAEVDALRDFDADQIQLLRHMLFTIIGDSADPGSCL